MVFHSNYKKFNQRKWIIFITCRALITTHPNFNIISGGLTECFSEPRYVWVSAIYGLQTATLLTIPEKILIIQDTSAVACWTQLRSRLAVVVIPDEWRRLIGATIVARAFKSQQSVWICTYGICLDMLAKTTPICDRNPIDLDNIYGKHVWNNCICTKCIRMFVLISLQQTAHTGVVYIKVVVYRVGVANQSQLNTSPCTLTSDFTGRRTKNTQRESWKTACLKTVHVLCTNSNVRITKVYTHSNQKSRPECSKQLTTGYHSYLLNQ